MANAAVADSAAHRAMRAWAEGLLPTPHILDATWWFDDATIAFFHAEMERQRQAVVVCLGTPTLLLGHARQAGTLFLLDRDPRLTDTLQRAGLPGILTLDLTRDSPPALSAGLVIADPPWYEAETMAFLAAAQAVARLGAEVYLSLPPLDTRPGIADERARLFAWCRLRGIELLSVTRAGTRYVLPPFEENVLRATGASGSMFRRVGDLARFRVERESRAMIQPMGDQRQWLEICFASTRLRLLQQSARIPGDLRLISMGWPGDIFPSCSRRHPDRARVEVWTSGNRAFRCHDTAALGLFLEGLRAENLPESFDAAWDLPPGSSPYERETFVKIARIVGSETREYAGILERYV